jgi:putative flippase GtrA
VLNAYLGYRLVVFRSRGSILRELPRFSLVYVVSLVIGLIALPIALNVLPFNIYEVQALLTIAVIIGSYVSHKYFSFGADRPTGRPKGSSRDVPAPSED